MKKLNLTDTQLIILSAAAGHPDLRILLPEKLRGGAATTVLSLLLAKGMIEQIEVRPPEDGAAPTPISGATDCRISKLGLATIGVEIECAGDALEAEGQLSEAGNAVLPSTGSSDEPRVGSKLANVIALLARPEAATIDDLIAETGWLPHSARAALTGLRKRGFEVVRAKRDDGVTIYRLPPTAPPLAADQTESAAQ